MRTGLYEEHIALKAKMVDFHGWELPLHYGSQLDEHHHVRKQVGIFDVSHMTVIDLQGENVVAYLRYLLSNDVAKLSPYQALYSCMLNEQGGVIDDLIAYKIDDSYFRLVTNSATHDKDLAWILHQAQGFAVVVKELSEKCIITVQGPEALLKLATLLPGVEVLSSFHCAWFGDCFVARTGYTGELGAEIIAPIKEGQRLWKNLIALGCQPCGLGARDTLRLEAGLNLYGNDMDETTSPLISQLAWTVALATDRDFIGKNALILEKAHGIDFMLVGLVLKDKGVLRTGQNVRLKDGREGVITSGGFSPSLGKGIAFARLPLPLMAAHVEQRGVLKDVDIVKLPFVRKGRAVYDLLLKDEDKT